MNRPPISFFTSVGVITLIILNTRLDSRLTPNDSSQRVIMFTIGLELHMIRRWTLRLGFCDSFGSCNEASKFFLYQLPDSILLWRLISIVEAPAFDVSQRILPSVLPVARHSLIFQGAYFAFLLSPTSTKKDEQHRATSITPIVPNVGPGMWIRK